MREPRGDVPGSRGMALMRRALVASGLLAAAACARRNVPLPSIAAPAGGDTAQLVARGEYIVRDVAACGGCHAADRAPDGPLSGGREFHDWRLGTIRAANLTPDSATGIGAWSDAEIIRALRDGERKDGSLVAPVMPYEWLHDMSDRDALAVARYLKSQPAVSHAVPESPNLIFRFARAFFLGPKRGVAPPAPPAGPTPAYGAYLARHVGLCADCHTPRTGLQSQPDLHRLFAGSAHPPKEFPANPANLTPDSATGIGGWSEDDFVHTLRTGVDPRGHALNPFMPWRAVARMSDDDLRAIYRYLRTLRPVHNEVPVRPPGGG